MPTAPVRATGLAAMSVQTFIYTFKKLPGAAKNRHPFNVDAETMQQRYMQADSAQKLHLTRQLNAVRQKVR